MCHALGRSASIDHIIASANSILQCDGLDAIVSCRWAKRWLIREKAFVKTLKSKPLSALQCAAHNKEDIDDHFKDYDWCKKHWGILNDNTYNFNELGCQIGVTSRGIIVVLASVDVVYVDDPNNKELVTLTECISTSRYHVPTMLIFKGAYHLRKYFDNNINSDTLFARSNSSFTNNKLTIA
jgi:hypothetical protein